MARRIKLTRDERIVLKSAIDNHGHVPDDVPGVAEWKADQIVEKLRHRGLLHIISITDEGIRAMAEHRQTTPKEVRA